MLTASLIIAVLVFISYNPNSYKNGFQRKFLKNKIAVLHSQTFKSIRSICGLRHHSIYFETEAAGNIIETDSTLSNIHFLKFTLPNFEVIQSLYFSCIKDSLFYIMAGNAAEVYKFNINNNTYKLFHFPQGLYSQAVVSGSDNYVLRAYKKTFNKWDQIFMKWDPVKNIVIPEQDVSDKKGDAGFSNDGTLLFDSDTQNIIYVAYYSNRFVCLDTMLHVIYKGHTIDTFSSTIVKAVRQFSHNTEIITNGAPLHEINLQSTSANEKLYIHSSLMADNETRTSFEANDVIDTYRVADGYYLGSFYIPRYNGERLKDFEISGSNIIVLYKNNVSIYSISFNPVY